MSLIENTDLFIFDTRLDSKHLYSLYGNDYIWIQEIFRIAHENFAADLSAVREAWNKQDMDGLKRSVHKIKPTFGFIGLPDLQQTCKDLEMAIAAEAPLSAVHNQLQVLLTQCDECAEILEGELSRLIAYNKSAT